MIIFNIKNNKNDNIKNIFLNFLLKIILFCLVLNVININNIYAGNVFTKKQNKYTHIEYYDNNKLMLKRLMNFNTNNQLEYFIEYDRFGKKKFLLEYFVEENNQINPKKRYVEYLLDGSRFCEKKYDKETGKVMEETYYHRGGIIKSMSIKSDKFTGRIINYENYNEKGEMTSSLFKY
ncbi:hypothetical protein ['Cynodon dactylon' phytoplasma]|uniref:hypothetical protein n=1 Tax='Cynodon dactylon' phytoplasma TaxID=295320 RepID=UPI001265B241|nr:hypothetical protein ['Cynodon dactylon' phytoplasma]KAB8121803.1 hypothetical protein F1741_01585 ['Cynodon dactylon' phytoplasma]